ncbi:MAG: hypothetical protein A2Y38_20130 [Spirochaetes bacterium GWB1_59_5]|nr:MAG: hypothetical protein A2Y38_20130 [Spirochaetes bacterium GWB1_59_5]
MAAIIGFKYSDAISPGSAVIVGASEGVVALPGDAGAGVFAGVFSAMGNEPKDKPNTNDSVGITVHGLCKVRVSGAVTAFSFGKVADATGAIAVLGAAPATPVTVAGFFMEPGADGELVDFFVQRAYIPSLA